MENIAKKEEFLKFRIDPITQDLMERARPYVNLDKSRFARQSIREKAETIIAEHEKTVFSEHDWHIFFNAIENPPEPNERLKKAAALYKEEIASS